MSHENVSPRDLAGELRTTAERLADSVRTDAAPADAASVLGDLVAVHGLLRQTYEQIAGWHRGLGEAPAPLADPMSSPVEQTVARLEAVIRHADMVDMWLSSAHAASARVEWLSRQAPVRAVSEVQPAASGVDEAVSVAR